MTRRPGSARHARGRLGLPEVRPLDRLRSLKIKLGVLVAATVTAAAFITWLGLHHQLGPTRTFPLAIIGSLVLTQLLAHGMIAPLREMTAAARAMARGDYSQRVRASSLDEVGELASAFNQMAEDLASVDTAHRELVANVSHELRTPVAALRAQLENLADGVTEPTPQALEGALAQTERLSTLLGYLLDFSRIEAGVVGLEVGDIDVAAFLEGLVAEADAAARSSGHDVTWEVSVSPPGLTLRGDEVRLAQVVANLLDNAARHSPAGSIVRVRVTTAMLRGEVVIDVVDAGAGIPVADRTRIFDRFQRGNSPALTGAPSTGGTGLGLAIARWAVSLHDGTLHVADSAPGEGATMRLRLPARGPQG